MVAIWAQAKQHLVQVRSQIEPMDQSLSSGNFHVLHVQTHALPLTRDLQALEADGVSNGHAVYGPQVLVALCGVGGARVHAAPRNRHPGPPPFREQKKKAKRTRHDSAVKRRSSLAGRRAENSPSQRGAFRAVRGLPQLFDDFRSGAERGSRRRPTGASACLAALSCQGNLYERL